MHHIHTTSTAVEKLKRQAKARRKLSGELLAQAQEAAAVEAGYSSWKHVTDCARVTQVLTPKRRALPRGLDAFLKAALTGSARAADAAGRFEHGLVFVMDAKDAEGVSLAGSSFEECDYVWPLAARDIWSALVFGVDDEMDEAYVDRLSEAELLELARDDLTNYRYFRYGGGRDTATAGDILSVTRDRFFFPPLFAWNDGVQIDVSGAPRRTAPNAAWVDIARALPTLPFRIVPAGDATYASMQELMRWAQQLEYIGTKAPPEQRRELLNIIGGTVPYVFTRRNKHYFLCHRGYEPVKGVIAFTREQLVECGVVAWHDAHGSHDGQEHLTLIGDDIRDSTDSRLLKRAARMLAHLALVVDKALVAPKSKS